MILYTYMSQMGLSGYSFSLLNSFTLRRDQKVISYWIVNTLSPDKWWDERKLWNKRIFWVKHQILKAHLSSWEVYSNENLYREPGRERVSRIENTRLSMLPCNILHKLGNLVLTTELITLIEHHKEFKSWCSKH